MRMTANQLCANRFERIVHAKPSVLAGDLGEKYAFKDVIADLFAKHVGIGALDGVDDLVRLLEQVMAQRPERLCSIPGAAVGRTKLSDDFNQPFKPVGSAR